jgi:hypothetical protein
MIVLQPIIDVDRLSDVGCKRLLAGVLAKLNDVALRIESITHRDAVE